MKLAVPSQENRSKQRGNAMVEFALGGSAFFALLFAAFDFGNHLFHKGAIRVATREGVRFGVTGQTLSGQTHDASIKTIVQQNSMGVLRTGNCADRIQVRYHDPVSGAVTASNAQGNILEVAVEGCSVSNLAAFMRPSSPVVVDAAAIGAMEEFPGQPPVR